MVSAILACLKTYSTHIIAAILTISTILILRRVVRYLRKERYFKSEEFLAIKNETADVIANHNEIAIYAAELRDTGAFSLGFSSSGEHTSLASFENTSQHKHRRDRFTPDYESKNVHNCSLQIVRKAYESPIKYLMKYFNINADEATLAAVEEIGNSIERLEEALDNLEAREESITVDFSPPPFILKYYRKEFMDQIGVELSEVTIPYPVYIFEYVSAGGNSSQRTPITLNIPTTDALLETISTKIKFRKSAAGQRALMTAKLRTSIKERDNYTCQQCFVSVEQEPHLLLEVDHIIPVSKGGLSISENLQALCWKCNRRKSNKMPINIDYHRSE